MNCPTCKKPCKVGYNALGFMYFCMKCKFKYWAPELND